MKSSAIFMRMIEKWEEGLIEPLKVTAPDENLEDIISKTTYVLDESQLRGELGGSGLENKKPILTILF